MVYWVEQHGPRAVSIAPVKTLVGCIVELLIITVRADFSLRARQNRETLMTRYV